MMKCSKRGCSTAVDCRSCLGKFHSCPFESNHFRSCSRAEISRVYIDKTVAKVYNMAAQPSCLWNITAGVSRCADTACEYKLPKLQVRKKKHTKQKDLSIVIFLLSDKQQIGTKRQKKNMSLPELSTSKSHWPHMQLQLSITESMNKYRSPRLMRPRCDFEQSEHHRQSCYEDVGHTARSFAREANGKEEAHHPWSLNDIECAIARNHERLWFGKLRSFKNLKRLMITGYDRGVFWPIYLVWS